MSRTARIPPLTAGEMRALALPWAACFVVMVLPDLLSARPLLADALRASCSTIAYTLGAVGLGALSIGHDYTDRTLGLLLSQPVPRQRLFLTKLGVLAALLLPLVVVAYARVFPAHPGSGIDWARLVASLLPALGGLCVAPWLTMACRSPLAGTVFALAMPGLTVVLGLLAWTVSGRRHVGLDTAWMTFLWAGAAVCAVFATAGWRLFMRLEALDERGADLHLPLWLTRRSANTAARRSPRHPVWRLVAKELRLQQMTLFLAGMYLAGAAAVVLFGRVFPGGAAAFTVLSVFYAAAFGLMIGSLASSEERQLGTHDWQMLLPMAASRQWMIKVGVALGLALLLAVGLPMAWTRLGSAVAETTPTLSIPPSTVLMLTVGGLYVSSLSRSGIRALLASFCALLGTELIVIFGDFGPIRSAGRAVGVYLFNALAPPKNVDLTVLVPWHVGNGVNIVLGVGLALLLLKFGSVNHRSAEHPIGRVLTQILVLMAYGMACVFVMSGVHHVIGPFG